MEERGSQNAFVQARDENDPIFFLSDRARAVLREKELFVERLNTLYREFLQGVENMVKNARLESFGEAYARCRDDFEAVLHDRLSDLEPELTRLKHSVANVECRVILLDNVRSCRGGAAVVSPVGVHQPADAPSAQSDRIHWGVAALGRVGKERENASVPADDTSIRASTEVQVVQENRRRGESEHRSTS